MSKLEPSESIESIVGARRHPTRHIGRAVSSEQRIYVLHSEECVETTEDLRDCSFSLALDRGIDSAVWEGSEDKAVYLGISGVRGLVPIKDVQ